MALLAPDEPAEAAATREAVERAVGMLVLVYDLDSDNGLELLRWAAQALNTTMAQLATQLTGDALGPARGRARLTRSQLENLRSACDDVLFDPGVRRLR